MDLREHQAHYGDNVAEQDDQQKLDGRFGFEWVLAGADEDKNVHASDGDDQGADSNQYDHEKRNVDQTHETFTGANAKLVMRFRIALPFSLLFLFGPLLRQVIQRTTGGGSNRGLVLAESSNEKYLCLATGQPVQGERPLIGLGLADVAPGVSQLPCKVGLRPPQTGSRLHRQIQGFPLAGQNALKLVQAAGSQPPDRFPGKTSDRFKGATKRQRVEGNEQFSEPNPDVPQLQGQTKNSSQGKSQEDNRHPFDKWAIQRHDGMSMVDQQPHAGKSSEQQPYVLEVCLRPGMQCILQLRQVCLRDAIQSDLLHSPRQPRTAVIEERVAGNNVVSPPQPGGEEEENRHNKGETGS